MKTSKKSVWMAIGVYAIVLALINLIIFSVFKPGSLETKSMKLVFWFSYGFLTLSFLLQVVAMFTGRFEQGVEAIFFGLPLFKIALLYFVITAILSTVFMILVCLGVAVPFALMLVLECILLGIFAIAFIISLMHKNIVQEIDQKIKRNVFAIRSLVTDVETMAESVENREVKAKLDRLAEDIRYSDPMTSEVVAELDLQIKDIIAELEVYVANNELDGIEGKIRQAQLLVSKRNKRLADSK